jgi:murein DD-endopeptidase MepM/ murein hydrolase activator NlpD
MIKKADICLFGSLLIAGFLVNILINYPLKKGDIQLDKEIIVVESDMTLPITQYDFVRKITSKRSTDSSVRSKKRWRVNEGDSLYRLLDHYGLADTLSHRVVSAMVRFDPHSVVLNVGDIIQFNVVDGVLSDFELFRDPVNFIKVIVDKKVLVYKDSKPTESYLVYKEGVINNSLYVDGLAAGLKDRVVANLTDIFAWDLDFSRDISKGDRFYVLYEEKRVGDIVVDTGRILGAKFSVRRNDFYAVYFNDDDSAGYFNLTGKNVKKAFLSSPVRVPRVTSKFTYNRYHPVLKINRPHRGVDYGGSLNTPIIVTGSGIIKKRHKQRAYGNLIVIDHGLGFETYYAHLNKFKKGLKVGSKVEQGDILGYMGKTGLATGVHLHYEFRIDGKHKDPLKIKLPDGKPVKNKAAFEKAKTVFLNYMILKGDKDDQ